MLTLQKINREIARVAKLEGRKVAPATAAYLKGNRVYLVGATGFNDYIRVRNFVAKNLGLTDVYNSEPGVFDPEKCEKL